MELVKMSDIQSGKQSSVPSSALVPMSAAVSKSSSGLVPMSQVAVKAPVMDPSESIDAIMQGQHNTEQSAGATPQPYGNGPYVPDKPAWNGWLDNPIVHGAETGLNWLQKPFETLSVGVADTVGAVNNLLNSHQQQNLDGTTTTNYPSQPRNFLRDVGNIWSNTNEHVSSDSWHGSQPNLNKMPGTSADWADVLDFGAQSLPFGEVAAPFKAVSKAVGMTKNADSQAFKQAIDEFIQRTQAKDTAEIPGAYATASRQGLVQELQPSAAKQSLVQEIPPSVKANPPDIPVPEGATLEYMPPMDPAQNSAVSKPLPPLRDNYVKPLSHYADTIYRETDPTSALDMIPGSNRYTNISGDPIFFSNNKDLALGQGNNKGVIIEMASKELQGHVNTAKPSWEMSYKNGDAEFIAQYNHQHDYQDAVKSVTIKPDATMDRVTKLQLKRTLSDWEQVKNPDGSVTFLRPNAEPAAGIQKMAEIQAMRSQGEIKGQAPKQPRTLETATVADNVQNYAGNHMPFRQAATQTDRTINRNQVVSNIRKNLGVTIDTGRLGMGKGVLGIYKTTPEVIRSGMAEDLQTISHEVGHHLDKKFDLQNPQFQGELNQLMQASGHNVSAYQPHQLGAEGVAEFVRLYVTDRAEALKQAPNFAKYFEGKLSAKALKGLEKTTKDIDTWITQGPANQAKGLVDFNSSRPKPSVFSWNKFYTRYVDDLNPIKLAEKALTGRIGFGKDSIYKMARLTRGIAERAKLALTDGIYINGTKVSEGLQQIVKPLETAGIKEKDFATYLAVKHAIDLKAMGKRVPFTDEHIAEIMKLYDTPLMQQTQQKIIQFNNSLLDILVEAGIKSPQDVAYMQSKYPNYVPFMRHFEEDAEAGFKNGGFGAAKAFANITDPVKKMSEEGSFRTIVNPIESMAKNAFLTMNAAAKNKVGLQLAELSKIDGAGKWVEKVPGASSPHEHVITVWENGVKQAYKVGEPELYNAMLTLDHESSISLIRFLGGAAGILRAGSTLTPEFMVRNAARDTMEAFIKAGMHPLDFAKGLVHVLGKSDTFNQFLSEGGAMGTMMALDREALQRDAMTKIFRESLKDKALNVITSPKELAKMITGITPAKKVIGALRHGAEVSELATKVGTYQKILNKTGSREEAAYTARDLMDFNRAGSNVRQTNRIIAFINSSLQGTDGMIRAFKQNPGGFAVKAFVGLVLPTIANYYMNKNLSPEDRKVFDNIPQWQKDSFLIVHVGADKFIRIPKPFELGTLVSTGTERILRALDGHDPEAFKGYGTALLQSLTPPIMISLLTPLLEATTNYSFFKKTPIVTQTYSRFEKVDQSDPIKTSETAKVLGQAANAVGLGKTNAASPLIIDNTIRGYTGGLGQYAVAGLDKVLHQFGVGGNTPKPAKNWSESSFTQPFFANTSGGGQIRQDFYTKWDDLSSAKASADRNGVPFSDPMYPQMHSVKTYIDSAMKQYKLIQKDKNMNSAEKRTQLDRLDGIMNTAAAHALGK